MEILKVRDKFVRLNNYGDMVGKPTCTLHMVVSESLNHFYLGDPVDALKRFKTFKKCKCGDNIYLFDVSSLSKEYLTILYQEDSITLVEYLLDLSTHPPIKCSKDLPKINVVKVREDYFVIESGEDIHQLSSLVIGTDSYGRITGIKDVFGSGRESLNVSKFDSYGINSYLLTGDVDSLNLKSQPSLETL